MASAAISVDRPEAPARPTSLRAALLAACVLLAHAPLLAAHAAWLWQRPHYQYFPMVPLGAACLAYQRLPGVEQCYPGTRRAGRRLWRVAWCLLALAVVVWSPWLGMVAALATLLAVAHGVGGARLVWQLLPAWAFLWLMVPLPLGLDKELISALQPVVTRVSSRLLDLLGLFHLPSGNTLLVEGRQILVEEACSGIQSLYSLLTCTCLYVLWLRRPFLPALILMVSAFGASLVANVSRVAAAAYLTTVWQFDVEEGWRHEALGVLIFVATVAFLLSWDRCLSFFWHPATPPPVPEHLPAGGWRGAAEAGLRWGRRLDLRHLAKPLRVAYALLAFVQAGILIADGTRHSPPAAPASVLEGFSAESLPAVQGPWRRRDFQHRRNAGPPEGQFSAIWTYESPAGVATVSADAPFLEWHLLECCYQSQGWVLQHYAVPRPPVGGEFVAVQFQKLPESWGYLFFSVRDAAGQSLTPPAEPASPVQAPGRWQRLCRRLNNLSCGLRDEPAGPVLVGPQYLQEQLFLETVAPLSAADVAHVEAFFLQVRARLRGQASGTD